MTASKLARGVRALNASGRAELRPRGSAFLCGGTTRAAATSASLPAPGVQVLATSRERLRLRAERVYEVRGLPVPLGAALADADGFDAVQLFVACVRHSHPQYTLGPADTVGVAQICRLTAGMPLGIELAAAWVPTLPVATIAAELATGRAGNNAARCA